MKNLASVLVLIFIALIFSLTLKGNFGNPSPDRIFNSLRTRGEPFELSPERGRYAITMALAQDKSIFLREDIAKFVVPDLGYYNNKYVAFFSPGVSILAWPFYVIGSKFGLAQVATFSVPAIFALFNLLLILKICGQLNINYRAGLIAAISFLFATPAFSYSVSFYQHQITTFLLLATISLLFARKNLLHFTLASFLVGISFWIDSQNPIFFMPIVAYAIYTVFDYAKEKGAFKVSFDIKYLLSVLGIILALGTYVVYSYFTFKTPFQLSGTTRGIKGFDSNNQPLVNTGEKSKDASKFFKPRFMIHGFATLTFNEDRGVIYYAPVLLIGLLGIPLLYSKQKEKALVILGTILFIFTLYSMWGDPYGGWAFGPRYLIPAFGFLSIFLAKAISEFFKKVWFKVLFLVLFSYSAFVNLLGALTTNQVPPKVEAVVLNMKWNYMLNWDMFNSGQTSSFLYKTYFIKYLSLFNYGLIILVAIISVVATLILFPIKDEKNK